MALSGHKDISMLKRYSHTQEDAKRSAIEKLGKYTEKSIMDTYLDTKDDLATPGKYADGVQLTESVK